MTASQNRYRKCPKSHSKILCSTIDWPTRIIIKVDW